MNLNSNIVTINRGVPRKMFGVIIVLAGLVLAVEGGQGGAPERWRLFICLTVSLAGALMIMPTDRLKLDFVGRRYLRVYGWAPFLHLRGGSFDDLEGISIHSAARGSGEGGGKVSRVLFLNWTRNDLVPFELASYTETELYDGTGRGLVTLRRPRREDLLSGEVAAELRAEEFRQRFGFHRVTGL